MRLLHVQTLALENFEAEHVPPYAILSHTWERGEVTFAAFQDPAARRELAGWPKVEAFCQLTAARGYAWAWIDTCCIDQRSSAELSEAINSMWRWYEGAAICFAYLADVTETSVASSGGGTFGASRWFTRGWTLQELLAPVRVEFLNREWQSLGGRGNLSHAIYNATGITTGDMRDPHGASVARRMSWAARRKTTRPEDIAYCLLGLFSVSMPLLYGEGPGSAFRRLQLEIIKQSDDESILAWPQQTSGQLLNSLKVQDIASNATGLIASSPSCFQDCHDIFPSAIHDRSPFHMTNKGLQISLKLKKLTDKSGTDYIFNARLNCSRIVNGQMRDISVVLGRGRRSSYYCVGSLNH